MIITWSLLLNKKRETDRDFYTTKQYLSFQNNKFLKNPRNFDNVNLKKS